MGVIGLEGNAVTNCNSSNLAISENSGAAISGAIPADSPEEPNKPTVQFILGLIEKLTPDERRNLIEIINRRIQDA